ncbi:MAG: potassium-transporting ATPase subunit F [Negativicutes bacterium]|jgi:K+-transporting ATPase KdpF subunit
MATIICISGGEMVDVVITGVAAAGLLVYLFYVLVNPEKI